MQIFAAVLAHFPRNPRRSRVDPRAITGKNTMSTSPIRVLARMAGVLALALSSAVFAPTALAQSCVYTLDPPSAYFPASGGNGSVYASIPNFCITTFSFVARSNVPWIQITNGFPRSDGSFEYTGTNGTVTYHVNFNPYPTMDVGTLTIAGRTFTVTQAGDLQLQTAIEYFHAAFGHYFVTTIPDEIAKLDAGEFSGWQRTGQTFEVFGGITGQLPQGVAVCRFFSVSFAPKSSHFYTPVANECALVKTNPDWQFEGEVFNVLDASGAFGTPGTCNNANAPRPLYRLYNQGQGGAPNHRYTTSTTIVAEMVAAGWVAEGFGPNGVIGCVP